MPNEPNVKVTAGLGSNHIVNNQAPTTVIKAYSDPVKVVVPADTQEKKPSAIAFERGNTNVLTPTPMPVQLTETAPEGEAPEKPATSAERRDAMKRANQEHAKAIQMQKEAKEMLAKAQHFQETAKRAATNPVELAKAIGMDPTEFLRRYQNEMFNIPNEEVKQAEPTVDERLKSYADERQKEKDATSRLQSEMIRSNYIQTKILPAIATDKEKFSLLNHNNLELSAGFIYDMMNDHFQKTGEELSANDVAEEMENQLQLEMEAKLETIKSIGKFSRHFQPKAEEAEEEVEPTPAQLGAKKTWTGAQSPVPTAPRPNFKDRAARLERLKKL